MSEPFNPFAVVFFYCFTSLSFKILHIYSTNWFNFVSGNQVQREAVARNETSVFFESVTSTVKGYLNPNYIV